jgi:hypothetical protein
MKFNHRLLLSAAAVAAAFASAPSQAFNDGDMHGTRIESKAFPADRTIVVDDNTRWVNVAYGETVNFVTKSGSSDGAQMWRFDGHDNSMNLSAVLPSHPQAKLITIYVDQAENPLWQSGSDDE